MLSNFDMFSEPLLADLGRVIAGWSTVQHQHFDPLFLSLVVMRGAGSGILLGDPEKFKIMSLAFARRITLFRKRITELELTEAKQRYIKKILDQLLQSHKDRNEIVHSMFSPTIKGGQVYSDEALLVFKSWKHSKEFESKILTQERLQEMFQTLNALSLDMVKLALDEELREANSLGPDLVRRLREQDE